MTDFHDNDDTQDDLLLMEYLDGELTPPNRRHLESRLAEEPDLREKLSAMERSWHSLDLLERTGEDKNLVETTLETVVLSVEMDIATQERQLHQKRWRRWGITVLLALLALAAGHLFVVAVTPDPNLLLLKEMPIIERFNRYRTVIDDVDLLFALADQRVFYDPAQSGDKADSASYTTVDRLTFSINPPFSELRRRHERLEAMLPEYYSRFYHNHHDFYRLDAAEQERYRRVNRELEQAADPEAVDRTLTLYSTWLRSLSTFEKTKLQDRSVALDDRIAEIRKKLQESPATRPVAGRGRLSNAAFDPVKSRQLAEFLGQDYPVEEIDSLLNQPPDIGYRLLEDAFERHQAAAGATPSQVSHER